MDVVVDWGADQPPAGLPIGEGWSPAPDAPMYGFLPAVWSPELRAWVPDRSTPYERRTVVDPATGRVLSEEVVAWSDETRREVEDDLDALLADAGVHGRPCGRRWLLKPPPGHADLDGFLDDLGRRADAAGIAPMCSAEFVAFTAGLLRGR